jgi:hypothetical protein
MMARPECLALGDRRQRQERDKARREHDGAEGHDVLLDKVTRAADQSIVGKPPTRNPSLPGNRCTEVVQFFSIRQNE